MIASQKEQIAKPFLMILKTVSHVLAGTFLMELKGIALSKT
jgi:hypothetical protein